MGRVNILTELYILSINQASPRKGDLEHIIHFFVYLKKKPKLMLYFDPSLAKIYPSVFTGDEPLVLHEKYLYAKE